jgi:hypothetical protein
VCCQLTGILCAGPVQVDPLSLLGQYSDEDEEEEQLSQANESKKNGSANIVAGQVEEQVCMVCIHKSLMSLSTII